MGDIKGKISKVESGNSYTAVNKTSNASGKYQFVRSTWEGLGYDWKDRFDSKLQEEAMTKLTNINKNEFRKRFGTDPSDADSYGLHFLGVAGYSKVKKADPNTPMSQLITGKAYDYNKNVFEKNGKPITVAQFNDWLTKKMNVRPSETTQQYSNQETQPYIPLDLNLPEMTGMTFAEEEKETEEKPQVNKREENANKLSFISDVKELQKQQQEQAYQPPQFLEQQLVEGVAYQPIQQSFQEGGYYFQKGGTWSRQQQALKAEKDAKLKKLLEQEKPVYKKKTFDEKLAEKRQEQETKVVVKDNTATRNYNDATKHSNVARNKTDKEIAEERKAIREKSDANVLNSWSLDAFKPFNYTRENIAEMAQGLESKFRVSDEPNFFDDYLNPANMIGGMASNLGQAPLQAEQTNSYMPYVTAVGTPLAVGAMAGYGTQNTGQFVNNLANPLAGIKNPFKNPQIDLSNSPGKMYGEHPTIVQAERLKNANIKDKYFKYKDYDQPIKENFTDKIKDKGTDINIYNYENFIDDIHNQTAFGEASYFNKSPQNLGSGSFRHKGNIFTDAPLNTQGKAIIEAHEKNHGVFAGTLREDVIKDLKSAFNSSKPIKGYKDTHQADEILARMAQFKNALGFSDNQVFTKGHLDLIRKNYPKEFVDNGITDMLEKIPKNSSYEKKFIQNMNKYAFGIAPIAGATYLGAQEQEPPNYQLGGIKIDPQGYWNPDNEGKPVVIPSPSITMKNVDFSVLGTSLETGEQKLMQPGQNYFFSNTKNVLEQPYSKLQEGGTWVEIDRGDGKIEKINTDSDEYRQLYEENRVLGREGDTLVSPKEFEAVTITGFRKTKPESLESKVQIDEKELQQRLNNPYNFNTEKDNTSTIRQEVLPEVKAGQNTLDVEGIKELDKKITKEKIIDLQTELYKMGYDLGGFGKNKDGIDGIIGDKTKKALEEYKKTKSPPKGKLTLEQEERIKRYKTPDTNLKEKALDFILGNAKEYIVNPVKKSASKILPENLQYDSSLETVSKYDQTGGKNYLLNNKSIADIRKEKNISFLQISNEGLSGNSIIPLKLKERVVNSINPQGYAPDYHINKEGGIEFDFFERFKSDKSKTEQVKRLEGVRGDVREDIFRMYSGLPQKHDTFTISSFKAGKNSDTNITFKNPNDVADYVKIAATHTDLFKKLADGEITPETIAKDKKSGKKGGDKINKASFRDPKNAMWNATFGIDFDKAGNPYLSFYDNWDLKGKDDIVGVKDVFGKPIEIYDRIPLTKELINAMSKLNFKEDDKGASDAIPTDDKSLEKLNRIIKEDPTLRKEYEKLLDVIKQRYK